MAGLSRRHLLKAGDGALAVAAVPHLGSTLAHAQTPKRGGTLSLRGTVTDLIVRQRRTFDTAKRRELIHEIQRYLAKQQYYVQIHSGLSVAVRESALKNYGPNLGFDFGGRVTAAWLDR